MINTARSVAGLGCFLDQKLYCRCVPCDGSCAAEKVSGLSRPGAQRLPEAAADEGTAFTAADPTCAYYGSSSLGESTSAECPRQVGLDPTRLRRVKLGPESA